MKGSWKTTVAGIVGAIATVALPIVTGGTWTWGSLGTAAAIAAIGYLSKDSQVTGGKISQ